MHFDLQDIIKTIGLLGVWGIVFAESGLLIGFFLPGDSLLFTAGFLASQGFFDIKTLIIGCFLAAVVGDSIGYAFGHKIGRKLFQKEDSLFFNKDHLLKAEAFYKKYGKKTIILARFVPAVRTFAPIVAGMGNMNYKTFVTYNIIGGVLWAIGVTYLGYVLGNTIPDIDKYLLPIIGLIIIASVAPNAYQILKSENNRNEFIKALVLVYNKVLKK